MFDEQPDGDPHGECAAEIHRLEAEVASLRGAIAQQAAVPAAPDEGVVQALMEKARDAYVHGYCTDNALEAALRAALQAVPQAGGLSDAEIDKAGRAYLLPCIDDAYAERGDWYVHARAFARWAGAVEGGR